MSPDNGNAESPAEMPWISPLKEIVTALIGLAIVGVTLAIALRLYGAGSSPSTVVWLPVPPDSLRYERLDTFERGKEILAFLLPLAGAIVGYYTGRVVADRATDAARREAGTARQEADSERSRRVEAVDRAIEGLDEIVEGGAGAAEGVEALGPGDAQQALRTTRQRADSLRRQLLRLR